MSSYLLSVSFACVTSFVSVLVAHAAPIPLVPFLIEVPNGTTQHNNPRIICPPTTWATLATFFVGNFVAHIVTVKSIPGERLPVTICNLILALLFPTSGLMRGLNAIARCVRFGDSELEKACRAGALCAVVRNSRWRPKPGDDIPVVLATRTPSPQDENRTGGNSPPSDEQEDEHGNIVKSAAFKVYHPTWLKEDQRWWIFFDTIWGRSTVNTLLFDIHGTYRLPRGYSLAVLPRNTIVLPRMSNIIDCEDDSASSPSPTLAERPRLRYKQKSDIASSGSVLKILASIFQLLFSYYTVYRHQGDQIQRWGYVSFFFTPLPYAVMSFCNGVSNLLTPDYARLYMVHSEIMDEAEEAGGAFDGVVGRVIPLVGSANDNGYKSGFASTWKGISPTSIKRAIASAFVMTLSKPHTPRTLTPAIAAHLPDDVDHNNRMQIRSEESNTASVYEITLDLISAGDRVLFDDNFDGPTKSSFEARVAELKRSPVFLLYYTLYFCFRHPERTIRNIKGWNRHPKMIKGRNPSFLLVFGIGIVIWSMIHPQRAFRSIREWLQPEKYLEPYKQFIGSRSNAVGTRMRAEKRLRTTIFYQSCPRFQRYDDPVPQKQLSAAITNTAQVLSIPAASEIYYPSTSSARTTPGITWTSTILPLFFGLLLSAVPVIIIGTLSHFHPGSSITTERVIILLWWSSGSIIGLLTPLLDVSEILVCIVWLPSFILEQSQNIVVGPNPMSNPIIALAFIPWSVFVAPIWGFVIIGQMLNKWGDCISLY